MMMLEQNQQKMKYSLNLGRKPIYAVDDDGNKIIDYIDEEGNIYYQETGSYTTDWSEPTDFMANISMSGGEAEAQQYGLSPADYDAVILSSRDAFPLVEGSIIWLNSEVAFEDDGSIDGNSADFTVYKVSDSINVTRYVLKAIVK